MSAYEPRTYRDGMGGGRFRSFVVRHLETDLWIGVDPDSYDARMESFALERAAALRAELEAYIVVHPDFRTSLEPVVLLPGAPAIAARMASAALRAAVGPMAAVAGAFSEDVGRALHDTFGCREIIVENGGDLWILIGRPLRLSVFAGRSPLSEKIGVVIPPEFSPLGVCTSSGTVGPSFSFGKADAMMIACRDAALADAFASAFGNRVMEPDDTGPVVEQTAAFPEIISALAVAGDRMAVRGMFELG